MQGISAHKKPRFTHSLQGVAFCLRAEREAAFFIEVFLKGNLCVLPEKLQERIQMETRVAVIGIIVEEPSAVEQLNAVLHEYGVYIIGRMGIPYREKGIHIISIAIDAPQDTISTLAGKIGKLPGVSVKTALSKVMSHE